MTTLKLLDTALREVITYHDFYETQVRAQWSKGDIEYFAVVVWDTKNGWIVEQKIARIDCGTVQFSYREQWI